MNFKKKVNGSWTDTPHYIHKTATDTITTLPTDIYVNDATATVGLKGNMYQASGVSPDDPIQPQECGERSGNLLPEFYAVSGEISGNSYTITKNSIETHNDGSVLGAYYVLAEFSRSGNYANYTLIDEKHSFKIPAGIYTFSGNENIHSGKNGLRLIVGQLGQTMSAGAINVGVGQTFTINADSYACPVLEIRSDSRVDEYILTKPMLNTGSTALPYEPYGIKIPISSGGENLFDKNWLVDGKGIFLDGSVVDDPNRTTTVNAIPVTANSYTLNYAPSEVSFISATYNNGVLINRVIHNSIPDVIDTTGANELRVALFKTGVQINKSDISNIMLNRGSTALPYEPYNRTITPIYLGEVETTRKIKKLIFDGSENWRFASTNADRTTVYMPLSGVMGNYGYCSHIEWKSRYDSTDFNRVIWADGPLYISIANQYLTGQTLASVKSYFATQYTKGTPVTIWYVLAKPKTGIVNEPLRKIGDYADEVSGISIPTIAGANTIDIDTTLKPSEVTVNYHGWHPVADVHEADNGAWT